MSTTSLPRLAMFHGGGSNSKIFRTQCEALLRLLEDKFELVFFDAPFKSKAGAGVLPFFSYETWGPYLSWFWRGENETEIPDGSNGQFGDEEGVERILRLMQEAGPGGKWVGCVGFSQGTRVVGGLLLYQQRKNEEGILLGDGEIDIKFGVLCMGAGAPMTSSLPEALLRWDSNNPSVPLPRATELISIPTLHMHGLKDIFYGEGKEQVARFYDPATITMFDIDYHHAMPWNKDDQLLLSGSITQMYYR